jgi:hypothetical protein
LDSSARREAEVSLLRAGAVLARQRFGGWLSIVPDTQLRGGRWR